VKNGIKTILLRELLILGVWVATYLVLLVILIFLAVVRFPSEMFVRNFSALLPLVLIMYLPYIVIKFVVLLSRRLIGRFSPR